MVRKLFISPPDIPEGEITRCLKIPASQEWLAVVNAAILEMTNPANYEQLNETDLTPEEAAASAYSMYETYLEGECGLMDCNDVLDCVPDIESTIIDNGTFNANIVNVNDTTILEKRFPETERQTEILDPPIGCDLDILFGSIREIVTRIDSYGLDLLQTLVANTDPIDRIADLIALVPLFGDIVGETLALVSQEADNLLDLYEAHQTIDLVDEITCDLFTMVCNDCRYPTYEELLTYYASLGITGIEDYAELSWNLIVDLLIDSAGASAQIVYFTVNAALLFGRYLGGTVQGQSGPGFIEQWAILGADSPSSDHETLCPCEEPAEEGYLKIDWYDNTDYLGATCAAGTIYAARYPTPENGCSLSLDDESSASLGHSLAGLGWLQGNYRFDVNVPFGATYHVQDIRIRWRKQNNNNNEPVRVKLFNGSTEVYDSGDYTPLSGTLYVNLDYTGLDVNATSISFGQGAAYRGYLDYIEVNRTV